MCVYDVCERVVCLVSEVDTRILVYVMLDGWGCDGGDGGDGALGSTSSLIGLGAEDCIVSGRGSE